MAWVGKLIIDAVVAAAAGNADAQAVLLLIGVEAALVALIAASQRGIALCESLLRAQLGYRVNDMILAKALTLELAQFEDSEFYDKLTRARRDASTRPLNLVRQSFGLLQNLISLLSYAALLSQLSVLAVGVFLLAGLPAFLAEAGSPARRLRCFAGARRTRACRFTWKPCWRARTTPRRSRSTALADRSWAATATSFESSTGATAAWPCAARAGVLRSACWARRRCMAVTAGWRCRRWRSASAWAR